jgi:transposase-like protein
MPEKHHPTPETKAKVIGLSCNGVNQSRIALHLGVAEKTLRLHYREQLDFGVEALLSRVLANLATIACRGHGNAAVSAAKYLLSCRAGYRERSELAIEPTPAAAAYFADAAESKSVRDRILARINAINADPPEAEQDNPAAYKVTGN